MHGRARTGDPARALPGADAAARARAMSWRIPLLYVVLGVLWIVFSDRGIALLVSDPVLITRLQTFKGGFYMVATAVLLYLLLRPLVERLLSSQQQALESEWRYRELFEANPSPMLTYELDSLRVVDANQAASAFLGWTRGELQGMDMAMLWPIDSQEQFLQAAAAVRDKPALPCTRLERLRLSSGEVRDVELRSADVTPGAGRPRTRLMVVSDRTTEILSQRSREQAMARLQEAQRLARLGSWEVDLQTRLGRFCPILQHLLGHNIADDRPRALHDVLVAADEASQARLDQLLDELAGGQLQKVDVLLPFVAAAGRERLLRLRAQHTVEDGRRLLRGTVQDVTEEQQTRRLLDEREQQFRELVRILPDGVMILSGENVIYANPACGGLFGTLPEALLGEPLATLAAGEDLPALRAWLDGRAPLDGPPRLRRSDGSTFRAALSGADARYGGQACRLLLVRDLSEPERMRDALAAGNLELQAMARRLFSAQEDERRAISRELHDDIGQAITAIKLSAHAVMGEDDPTRRQEDLEAVVETADTTLDKLRNLSMLLRPPQLDALGLEAALRWHAGVLFRNSPVQLDLDIRALPRRPEREVEQACFRIAQEGLTNALRHAGARSIQLALDDDDGRGLSLRIDDDGRGFEPGQARGLGLVIMRERAQSAGGQLHIETLPGGGTHIRLQLPYAPHTAAWGERA
ncbi:PAS domain S-box protein [Pseudoxanthomonas sp.]|uniref:PAS domain S-box protein n=1 Tax=Pseudoxanthomonas sp. TaxID=1871049 RepID=UPI00258D653A|nr:PAS domain S-box protein [Pseudoxanthomonas sp.]MCR6687115.1 PAS domain S-box protein [Pseudoxanthomonas sp.]